MLASTETDAGALAAAGDGLRARGRHELALSRYDRALAADPALEPALHGRALALLGLDRLGEAVAAYDRALRLRPGCAALLTGKGNLLTRLGRHEDAARCYDAALAGAEPGSPGGDRALADAHFFRGDLMKLLGRLEEAVAAYDQALALRPDHVQAWTHRGMALNALDEAEDALASYDRALALQPDDVGLHLNRSGLLRNLGRSAEALAAADRAVAADPASEWAHYCRGTALRAANRVPEALACFERAAAAAPGFAEPHVGAAMCWLQTGDLARGWAEDQWRWDTALMTRSAHRGPQPLWRGERNIGGARILLHAEQGFGDTLQFCRYAALVAGLGATVILGVQPALLPLLEGLPGPAQVVSRAEALPRYDLHCPLLSLPLAFGTRLETIPAAPYLAAPEARAALWRERLGDGPGLRVGVAWSGNTGHRDDRNRSMPLAALAPLAELGLPLYSVQRHIRPGDLPALAAMPGLAFFGPAMRDFADTAALLTAMDLVVTVDTAVAHLAGAMGKPVWLMLPHAADWRWMLDREDSPWYPSMRLFRQRSPGDWDGVIARVRRELADVVAGRSADA